MLRDLGSAASLHAGALHPVHPVDLRRPGAPAQRGRLAAAPLYVESTGLAFVSGVAQPLGIAAFLLLLALAAWAARSQGTRWYGLVLLALLALRLRRGDPLGRLACTTACAWMLTTAIVLALALAVVSGVVRLDFKLPRQMALFLVGNLRLTCVAEQAMFRTLAQDPLRRTPAGS